MSNTSGELDTYHLSSTPESYSASREFARVEEVCLVQNMTDPLKDGNSYDNLARLLTLSVEIAFGNIGCIFVFVWLWTNSRRLKSRVNLLILHVTIADLYVADITCLSQLITETMYGEWLAGDVMCRVVRYLQIVGMFSSTNMVLMLAFDRHQAIRSPLKQPVKVWILVVIAWAAAFLGASPQLFLFEQTCLKIIAPDGVKTINLCYSKLRKMGTPWRTQVYLLYSSTLSFFIPVCFLLITYSRIFLKICKKEKEHREHSNGSVPVKPGKIRLHSTNSTSLRKARTKTLVMTIVIVVMYVICTLPYIIVEMTGLANSGKKPPPYWPTLVAILAGMLPTNSVVNPYVFLLFNANIRCFCDFWQKCTGHQQGKDQETHVSTRSEYLTNSSNPRASPHYYRRDGANAASARRVDFATNGNVKFQSNSTDIELRPIKRP